MTIDLTEEQRTVMLKLGDTESTLEIAPLEVVQQLIDLDLIYRCGPKQIDFTDLGESIYDELAKPK